MTEHVDMGTLAMFREGLLAASQAADVQAHLTGCERCGQASAQLEMVTDLLAASAPPAMPPGLSARIATALAAESAARSAAPAAGQIPGTGSAGLRGNSRVPAGRAIRRGAGSPPPPRPAGPTGPTGPTGSQPGTGGRPGRQRIRRLVRSQARLRLLAAAAALAVVGGGGYALTQLTAGGPGGMGAAASGSSAQRHAPESQPMAGPAAGIMPGGPASSGAAPAIRPVTSGTDYTRSRFASELHGVLRRYPANTPSHQSTAAEHPPLVAAVASCVHAVIGGRPPRLVDIARYQGHQAIIIVVAGSGNAPARAWVTAPDCSAARPDVLARFSLSAGQSG